jgi:hypothetical protein
MSLPPTRKGAGRGGIRVYTAFDQLLRPAANPDGTRARFPALRLRPPEQPVEPSDPARKALEQDVHVYTPGEIEVRRRRLLGRAWRRRS